MVWLYVIFHIICSVASIGVMNYTMGDLLRQQFDNETEIKKLILYLLCLTGPVGLLSFTIMSLLMENKLGFELFGIKKIFK